MPRFPFSSDSPFLSQQASNTLVVMSRLFVFSVFSQTRLYAAQAARKVEFTGAAEHVKFQPQDVQVSGG